MPPDDVLGPYTGQRKRRRVRREDLSRCVDANSGDRQVVEGRLLQQGFDCGLPQRDDGGRQMSLRLQSCARAIDGAPLVGDCRAFRLCHGVGARHTLLHGSRLR